ncbi:MAG: hypothetical protein IPI66_06170 [Chitinophagaceae bacterium]|nr:hypothetical protein [Chitinophagaceae bacterium]
MRSFIIFCLGLFSYGQVSGQGCVAIKSGGMTCSAHASGQKSSKSWQLSTNNRYFRSYKHFVGTVEQKQRVDQGTQVINHAYSMDLSLLRRINSSWSVMINLPILSNTRSSLYEHDRKKRNSTNSFGIGDIRLAAYKWLHNPDKYSKGNVQVGVGIKLPTGDYKYQDYFHTTDSTKVLGPVDQSIQLGDGGTGFSLEVNGYYQLIKGLSVYGNFFYLLNPREQNGVSTARGGVASASSIAGGSDVMSVPDQYMFRAGLSYMLQKFSFSAGIRDECLPVHDLIGGSAGFRRPGYIISVEPSIAYEMKNFTAYVTVPFAVKRSRTQSVPDRNRTKQTGVYTQGDAAFSDYTINIGCAIKF